eukprot:Opistho-2@89857
MASIARIEVIQYKEIITPEWRDGVKADGLSVSESGLVEENVSDDAFARRHHPQELLEKARYASFVASGRHGAQAGSRAPPPEVQPPAPDVRPGPGATECLTEGMRSDEPAAPTGNSVPVTPLPTPNKRRRSHGASSCGAPNTPLVASGAPGKTAAPAHVLVMRHDGPCGYPPRKFPMTEKEYDRLMMSVGGGVEAELPVRNGGHRRSRESREGHAADETAWHVIPPSAETGRNVVVLKVSKA